MNENMGEYLETRVRCYQPTFVSEADCEPSLYHHISAQPTFQGLSPEELRVVCYRSRGFIGSEMTRGIFSVAPIVPHQSPTPNGTMNGFPVTLKPSSGRNMALARVPNQSGQSMESREKRPPPRVRLPVATAGIPNKAAISKLQEDLANIELKYVDLKEATETERAAIGNERDSMIADKALLEAEREAIKEERLRLEQTLKARLDNMKIIFNDKLREYREQVKATSFDSITVADAASLVDTHPKIIAAVQNVITAKSNESRNTLLQSITDAEVEVLINSRPALSAAIKVRIASESSKSRETLLQSITNAEAYSLLTTHPVMVAATENKVRKAKKQELLDITPEEARHLFHINSTIVRLTRERVAAGPRIQQGTVPVKDKGYATLPQADIDEILKSNPIATAIVADKIRKSTESGVNQARTQWDIELKLRLKAAKEEAAAENMSRAIEDKGYATLPAADVQYFIQHNPTAQAIMKGNIYRKAASDTRNAKLELTAEFESKLREAKEKADAEKAQAVLLETKKSTLKLNMAHNRHESAELMLCFLQSQVELAPKTSPDEAMKLMEERVKELREEQLKKSAAEALQIYSHPETEIQVADLTKIAEGFPEEKKIQFRSPPVIEFEVPDQPPVLAQNPTPLSFSKDATVALSEPFQRLISDGNFVAVKPMEQEEPTGVIVSTGKRHRDGEDIGDENREPKRVQHQKGP